MRTNLAGRAGRWSAAHWKLAALGWVVFAVAAVAAGLLVGAKEMKQWEISNGDSRRAEQILDAGHFNVPAKESVLVQSATTTVDQPAFASAVAGVIQTLAREHAVTNIV